MLVACPSCGAEVRLWNPASLSVTCAFCDTISLLVDANWTDSGRQSRLSQGFSKLYVGCAFRLKDRSFQVLGRVRYSFGRGFWDEWYVQEDTGECHWITEDDHEFALQQQIDTPSELQHIEGLNIGQQLFILSIPCQILEVGQASCLGIEGELPRNILPNEHYAYADGSSLDGKYTVGFEFDDDAPTVFWGEWVSPTDIQCEET